MLNPPRRGGEGNFLAKLLESDQLTIRPVPLAVLQDLQVKLPNFFVAQSKEVSSPAVRQHLKSPLSHQLIGAPVETVMMRE